MTRASGGPFVTYGQVRTHPHPHPHTHTHTFSSKTKVLGGPFVTYGRVRAINLWMRLVTLSWCPIGTGLEKRCVCVCVCVCVCAPIPVPYWDGLAREYHIIL